MKQLDGLRAFAVVCTMITHFTLSQTGLLGRVPWGQMGVRLFFVLSGFLITGILLKSRGAENKQSALRVFYARRFLRIFPVYYATLAIAALLNVKTVRQSIWWHVSYLSNFYEILKNPPASAVTHLWSLAVEEQFYLVWPCLIIFIPRRHLLKVILATIFLGPLSRVITTSLHVPSGDSLLFACLDTLGMGALLAYCSDQALASDQLRQRFQLTIAWVGLPAFVLFLVTYAARVQSFASAVLSDLALAFAFTWVVKRAAASFQGWTGALLENRSIRYVGRISYGVYLLHPFTMIVLFYATRWLGVSLSEDSPVRFFILVGLSIGLAALSWHFFESPINAYKKNFQIALPVNSRQEVSK